MQRLTPIRPRAAATLGLLAALAGSGTAAAEGAPPLWGYGVKGCPDYLAAAPAPGAPEALGGADYLRYREWLAGLVTGLNLATGSDVLKGAELDAALGRIRAHCQAHPDEDFFNAALALVKSLGRKEKKQQSAD